MIRQHLINLTHINYTTLVERKQQQCAVNNVPNNAEQVWMDTRENLQFHYSPPPIHSYPGILIPLIFYISLNATGLIHLVMHTAPPIDS